jgi:heat shock protein HspQ
MIATRFFMEKKVKKRLAAYRNVVVRNIDNVAYCKAVKWPLSLDIWEDAEHELGPVVCSNEKF